mgnify:CR=1 FL=1
MSTETIKTIFSRAQAGETLGREDALKLLAIPNGSREYYELLGIANRDARRPFANRGQIFAQIGIEASPCAANCAFCSLAEDVFDGKDSFVLPVSEAETITEQLVKAGVDELFLMTTANYGKEAFLSYAAAVKKHLPKAMRFVANVGDFDEAYAQKLKEAGFTGVYHIRRLGEGVDNAWFLLRLSLHDPVLPLNAESDVPGGIKVMLKQLYDVINDCEDVDLTPLKNAIEG